MHLIEILLPLRDNDGRRFDSSAYASLREQLVERFGGLTAFSRSPAEGIWEEEGELSRDEIIIFEVMAEGLDRRWWADLRRELEGRFRQNEIVIRSREIERL
jgi:hypothetical protein